MNRRTWRQVAVLVPTAAVLAACTQAQATTGGEYQPSKLTSVAGNADSQLVTLTDKAAQRIGLKTAPVTGTGGARAVPSEALIYFPDGRSYVYVAMDALSFLRTEVTVTRDDGVLTQISAGPPAGSQVVTTGATEVYGAEFEVGK